LKTLVQLCLRFSRKSFVFILLGCFQTSWTYCILFIFSKNEKEGKEKHFMYVWGIKCTSLIKFYLREEIIQFFQLQRTLHMKTTTKIFVFCLSFLNAVFTNLCKILILLNFKAFTKYFITTSFIMQ
jgi:hypothetical protein